MLRGLFREPYLHTSNLAAAAAAAEVALSAMQDEPEFGSAWTGAAYARVPLQSSASSRRETMSMRRRRGRGLESTTDSSVPDASNDESNAVLKKMLREVEHRALIGGRGHGLLTGERITRVPVTEEIVLSARYIKDEDAHFVEKSAALLRRIGLRDQNPR